MGTLFVNRERRQALPTTLAALRQELQAGHGVVLFPEATSTAGARVLPFRSPLLAVAAADALPVHWGVLAYRTPPGEVPAHLALCWWGEQHFVPNLWRLLGVRRSHAWLELAAEPVEDTDRKRLAARLHERVAARFVATAPAGFDPDEPDASPAGLPAAPGPRPAAAAPFLAASEDS